MVRLCPQCGRQFTAHDFFKDESRGMEAERRFMGLEGVRFLYYHCPDCNADDIFVDVHRLAHEDPGAVHKRREELEAAVRAVHARDVGIVITEKLQPCGPR